jgi:cell division protein FtsB
MDVEEQRRQLHEMATSRKQLQDSVADLQDRLDVESQARNDEACEAPSLTCS